MADMPPPPDPKPAQEQISEWAKKYRGVRVTLWTASARRCSASLTR